MIKKRELLAGLALLPLAKTALAQEYPNRAIRLLVGFAAGGSTDVFARVIAPRLQALLGQPVVIENRPGAGGNIATETTTRSAPDGYTLLLGSNGPLTNAPVLQARLPYDPERDFAAVAMISRSPVTLSVRADSPFRTIADLLAAARAKPGDLSIGSSGQGSATHFLIEQVMAAAGINLTHVPYRGSSQSVPDLIAGNIPLVMAEISTILPLWQSGRARILAMSSAGRMPIAPEIPTLIEQGLNLTGGSWAGLVTAAGAPPETMASLAAAVQAGLREPTYRARQAELGAEIVAEAEQNPAGFAAWLRRERAEIRAIADRAGIKPE